MPVPTSTRFWLARPATTRAPADRGASTSSISTRRRRPPWAVWSPGRSRRRGRSRCRPSTTPGGPLHPLTRWANRFTARLDAEILAVSEETRSSLRGAAARHARVLVHGIDVARVSAPPDATGRSFVTSLGIGRDELVIGTVANLRPQKDYATLLRAMRCSPTPVWTHDSSPLAKGRWRPNSMRWWPTSILPALSRFTGYREDAARVMAAFDVFTLASAWEGLPVALMEALAIGLPVVATRLSVVSPKPLATPMPCSSHRSDPLALAAGLREVLVDPTRRARSRSPAAGWPPDFR